MNKKTIPLTLFLLVLSATSVLAFSCSDYDINTDGNVNLIDFAKARYNAIVIRQHNGCDMSVAECSQYDINGDNRVNLIDFAKSLFFMRNVKMNDGCNISLELKGGFNESENFKYEK